MIGSMRLRPSAALLCLAVVLATAPVSADGDPRLLVELPDPMQGHMLANMRNHLEALSEMYRLLAAGKTDAASALVEQRLGMSSLEAHGAAHMASYMPKPMRDTGEAMHRAASRLALAIQEGEPKGIDTGVAELLAQCTACHRAFRIR
jgi:hypothetical protein